jgi:hypothetical protein
MTNQEKKQQIFADVQKKYSHLSSYCTIEARGLDDDSLYFHPTFIISEDVSVTSQGDTINNYIYAMRINYKINGVTEVVDVPDNLLDQIIVGWHTNQDKVLLAISTLQKVRNHINNLNDYASDYVVQLLMGNSLNELTNSFINEFKTTQKLIEFIDLQKKSN